jgi:hypothetical protein
VGTSGKCVRCGDSGESTVRVAADACACALCGHMWWIKFDDVPKASPRDLGMVHRLRQSFRIRLRA